MICFILGWLLIGIGSYSWIVRVSEPPPSKYYKLLVLFGPILLIAFLVVMAFEFITNY